MSGWPDPRCHSTWPSSASPHLVTTRRDGNRVFYSAVNEHVLRLVTEALFHADHVTSSASPMHHTKAATRAS